MEHQATPSLPRPLSTKTVARSRAAIAFAAPLVFFLGMACHPFLPDLDDSGAVGEAAAADPTRWVVAHVTLGVAFGLMALAFLALRAHLREAGEERWSAIGTPFVVLASCIFVFLPAIELGPVAAARAGGDAAAMQAAVDAWFGPFMASASLLFLVGALSFATALVRARVLPRATTWVVVAALVVMALARVPASGALLAWGAAAVVAFWPIGRAMWSGVPAPAQQADPRGAPVAP